MNIPTNDLAGLAWSQLWQVTALAVVVAFVTLFTCRRRPHLAYALWMLVVLKCLTPPLWSSPAGLFSWAQYRVERAEAAPAANDVVVASTTLEEVRQEPVAPRVFEQAEADDSYEVVTSSPPPAPETIQPQVSPPADRISFAAMVAVSWMVGSAVMAGLMRWKWSGCRRALRNSATAADAGIERLTAELAGRLGLKRKVRVLVTSEPIGPAVFGFLRPVIVLPQALVKGKSLPSPFGRGVGGEGQAAADTAALTLTLSQRERGRNGESDLGQIEPILAHELIHLRRGDTYWGAVQLLVEVLWWFHPLVWWANRETCRQRERCCDEEVVAGLKCRPAAYARCLLDVLELERNWQPMLAVTALQSRKDTSKRLEDIMKRSSGFRAKAPRWSWALLLVAAALVLPGKALVLAKNDRSEAAATQEQEEPSQEKPLPSDHVAVTVLVVDAKGQPVKGAEVIGWNSGDGLECNTYQSDDNGRATIPWQRSALFGVFRIIARSEKGLGWHGSQPGPDVAEEAIKRPIKITLLPRTRITDGVCVDADGQPLSGVSVRVTGLHHAANGGIIMHGFQGDSLGSAVSDEQGRYSIKLPECRLFRMTAEHPRFVAVDDSRGPNSKPGRFVLREPAGQVQGRVVDAATGSPIRGAKVFAQALMERRYGETGFRMTVSDENGRYTLGSMAPGAWNILFDHVAGKPELTAAAVEGVEVKANETAAAQFRVAPGRRLSGQVIDAEKNAPLAGVSVGYYGSARPRSGAACLMVKTDAEGRFQFFVPPGGSFVYVAQSFEGPRQSRELIVQPDKDPAPVIFKGTLMTSPHYEAAAPTSDSVAVVEGEARVESPDDLAYTVRGTFRTFDRKPVPTATVVVRRFDGKNWQDFSSHRVSCHDSRFQIYLGNRFFNDKGERDYVLEERFYRNRIGKTWCLVIDVPGYARPKPVEFMFEKEIKPLTVQLERPKFVPVRGRVVDADGRPVADANVSVLVDAPGGDEQCWGPEYLTDADGRFELKHVYVGCTFAVRIDKEDQQATSATMTLKDSAVVDLGALQLHATDGDAAAAPKTVRHNQPDGRIAMKKPHTTVTGQIIDAEGKGIAGAQVAGVGCLRSKSADDLLTDRLQLLGTTTADASGRFEVELPRLSSAACYEAHLVAQAEGHDLGQQSIGLDVGRPQMTLALGKETTIHGRLLDADGKPAAGAKVFVTSIGKPLPGGFEGIQCWRPPSQLPFWPKSVTADAEGRFTLRGVDRSGILNVQVRDDRFGIDWLHIGQASEKDANTHVKLSPSGEVTLSPPPARFFEGTITYEDTHKPAAKARVEIGASVDPHSCIMNMAGQTDADGRFRLNPYSGKIFHITVHPPEGEPYLIYQKEIKLADGHQPPSIDVALPQGILLHGKITEKSSGKAVAGATVKYEDHSRPPYRPDRILPDHVAPSVYGVTGSDGTYRIAVAPGSGVLFVQGPHHDYIHQTINSWDFHKKAAFARRHYIAAYAALDLKPNQEPAERNFTIRRGVTVKGTIVGPDNKPPGDVLIVSRHFIGASENEYRGGHIRAKNGQFALHGLDPDASVPFHFLDPKNETGTTVEISGRSADSGLLVVRLQPCGKAVARFVTPEGKPAVKYRPLFKILVSPGPFMDDRKRRKEISSDEDFVANFDREHYWGGPLTDAEGRCTFPALIPGAIYRLSIFNKIQNWDEKDFSVKPGETLQLPDITVRKE
jgi:beta-lactamase regulating signal transducer with metallopeptidase domain/protocatechuate 3,4-dioxygenase beta subunit